VEGGDPGEWDWTQPYEPVPVEMPLEEPPRSPYSTSLGTKLLVFLGTLTLLVGGLVYIFRYDLGLSDGSYAFLTTQPGTDDVPVTYPSCQPISYVVNDEQAVPGAQQLVEEAVDEVSAATGLSFVPQGTTSLGPGSARLSEATLLISWTDEREVPRLLGDTVGVGGSSVRLHDPGTVYYVSGEISLDAPDLSEILSRDGPETVRAVIMHELGHVVGLDHVDDRNELMSDRNVGRTSFGPGDLRGLAELGRGGCDTP
jgi:hypothetical protein